MSIHWEDTKGVGWLKEPFICYVGDGVSRGCRRTRKFADWMYGLLTGNGESSLNPYGAHAYGAFLPENLVQEALRVTRNNGYTEATQDVKLIENLEAIRDKLISLEKQLYKDLKCKNFDGFKKLWYGLTRYSKTNIELKKKYWLNYHLDLMTGETQRLFASSDRTLIEKIYALAAIELDLIQTIGIENSGRHGGQKTGKKALKEELRLANLLEIPEEKIAYKGSDTLIDVYIPTKEYRGSAKMTSFTDAITSFYLKHTSAKLTDITADTIGLSLNRGMVYALLQIVSKAATRLPQGTHTASFEKFFMTLNFTDKRFKNLLKLIKTNVRKYVNRARAYTLNNLTLKRWQEDNKDGSMLRYIEEMMDYLCDRFYEDSGFINFISKGINKNNAVQGFFGELAAHGKALFNLKDGAKKTDVEVYNVGNLREKSSNQLSGVDTVITVNGFNYGIQTKNPFLVDDGYYFTYKKKMAFSNLDEILKFFDFDRELLEYFELYNLNMNNSTNPSELRKNLESFLFMYSDKFARLDWIELGDDELKDNMKHLLNMPLNNVFFILKGEIFPSSSIAEGLIALYNYFVEHWKNYARSTTKKQKTLIFTYTNDIEPNKISDAKKASAPYGLLDENGVPQGEKLVKKGNQLANELAKIRITSELKLTIPSINELTILRAR